MFNSTCTPSNILPIPPVENTPSKQIAVIKLVFGPLPHIEVRRRKYRIYYVPTPASVTRISRLADRLMCLHGWSAVLSSSGWSVIEGAG